MNQHQGMFLIDLNSLRKVSEVLNKILILFLNNCQANTCLDTVWIKLKYSYEASPCHLVFLEVKETVTHSDSCFDG